MKPSSGYYESTHTQNIAIETVVKKECDDDWKPYACERCGATFKSLVGYKGHQLIHDNIKPYNCMYCDRAFRDLSTCRRHEEYHRGDRKYECKACNGQKKFVTHHDLHRHQDLCHPVDTLFHCLVCDKSFATQRFLNMHVKKHPPKQNQDLQTSQVSTVNPSTSRTNRRTAENCIEEVKIHFKCRVCQKVFMSQRKLDKHQQRRSHIHHESDSSTPFQETLEENYIHECPICLSTFKSINVFAQHYETNHEN